MAGASDSAQAQCELQEPRPGCLVLKVRGEVDASGARDLESQLLDALAKANERLVVDLTETTFFDSAGIRALIVLHQRAGPRSDSVRLVMPERETVRRALDLVAIDRIFVESDSVAAALGDPVPQP